MRRYDWFYDVFLKRWRKLKYYEKYKTKVKQIEGVWIHDCFGNCEKVGSLIDF